MAAEPNGPEVAMRSTNRARSSLGSAPSRLPFEATEAA